MESDHREALKARGAGKSAPPAVIALYREAFERFGAFALWSRRPSEAPTIGQVLVIADALRREGNLQSRRFASAIEDACRAAL